MSKVILIIASAILLTACALLQKGEELNRVFVLRPIADMPSPTIAVPPSTERVAIAIPTASPGLDTQHIILFTSAQALDFYANAEWASRLPEMLRASMVGSFENSHRFESVTAEDASIPANLLVLNDIKQFEAYYETAGSVPHVRVSILTKLVSLPSREVILSVENSADVPATADKIADIVTAFDAANAQVQTAMIEAVAKLGHSVQKRNCYLNARSADAAVICAGESASLPIRHARYK